MSLGDLIQAVGLAKSKVDHGFSEVGRELRADDPAQRALTTLAARSIALANALVVLVQHDHANEAIPLLRSLVGAAAEMRWIADGSSESRARAFLSDSGGSGEPLWSGAALRERLARYGFSARAREALGWDRAHWRANAQGLPWGHVFADREGDPPSPEPVAPEALLEAAVESLGQALFALHQLWPASFEGSEELRQKVK